MGCDWYKITYCEGCGIIFTYEGTVTGFIGLCQSVGIDYTKYDIRRINYDAEQKKKITTFIMGNMTKVLSLDIPGPYEITCGWYDYTLIDEKVDIKIPDKLLKYINLIACGNMKLLSSDFDDIYPYEFDEPTTQEEKKYGKEIFQKLFEK